jgi:hypothetical protein
MPGIGIVGAEPVDDQRAQREPDALLELFALRDGAEIDVCRLAARLLRPWCVLEILQA